MNEEEKAIEKLRTEIDNIKISILGFERDVDDKDWLKKITRELKNDILTRETVLNLIETQKAEIEKRDNQLKEKDNIINKTSLEAQRYFDTTIEQALKFDKELENKDRIINLMAEQLTTPIHSKEWIIEHYRKLAEGANHD